MKKEHPVLLLAFDRAENEACLTVSKQKGDGLELVNMFTGTKAIDLWVTLTQS